MAKTEPTVTELTRAVLAKARPDLPRKHSGRLCNKLARSTILSAPSPAAAPRSWRWPNVCGRRRDRGNERGTVRPRPDPAPEIRCNPPPSNTLGTCEGAALS